MGCVVIFLGRIYVGKPTTVESFFLNNYSDWETLIKSEITKTIIAILLGVAGWWYEKHNLKKNNSLPQ